MSIKRSVQFILIDFGKVTLETFEDGDDFVTLTLETGDGSASVSAELSRQDVKTLADELLNWRFE